MPNAFRAARSHRFFLLALILVAGCGGGGGSGIDLDSGGSTGSNSNNDIGSWTSGVYLPAGNFAAQCTSPRSGIDPSTGLPYPDIQGSRLAENNWLRSWSNELYLWYNEIVDRDPAAYETLAYFDLLKTFATTASGAPKDRFHFTLPTAEWQALSQSGVSAGYGATWALLATTPPRRVVVAYTEPNSPATAASLARGTEVLTVDGVDLVNATGAASVATLNAGLFPAQAGETHVFTIRDLGAPTPRTVTLRSANVVSAPVQNVGTVVTATGRVGYLLFNDHIATAEQALIDAIAQLQAAGVADLVLDLRYNGGGFLNIASELAYMIAGPGPTAGQPFERIVFNDKHPNTDPVTGAALVPIPFRTTALGFSAPAGQALPTLNLSRVYVLTGPGTCSASESIINGLRGVDVEVIQIGSTTCGKPYGFYPTDNCGTTYFTIQFKGINAKGFGDYADGFSPANTVGAAGTPRPGCSVADDYTRALGDPLEGRFAAALAFRDTRSCPAPSGFSPRGLAGVGIAATPSAADRIGPKSPWRENRWLDR